MIFEDHTDKKRSPLGLLFLSFTADGQLVYDRTTLSYAPYNDGGGDGEGCHCAIKEKCQRGSHDELGTGNEKADIGDDDRVDEISEIGMASEKRKQGIQPVRIALESEFREKEK